MPRRLRRPALIVSSALLSFAPLGGCGSSVSTGGSAGGPGVGGATQDTGDSVLQHHHHATRDGVYVQPALTRTAAAGLHRDTTFTAVTKGRAYAQPLYLDAGKSGKDLVFVATEQNWIHALDAATGAVVWEKQLGSPVALADLPCGNIDPLGVTGTPVIDAASRTIFADAMTTPDGGGTKKHLIFGLSIDDGAVREGFPIDVDAKAKSGSTAFQSKYHNQRGALAIVGGTLYVPYGGHYGDCGEYNGWIVGVPLAHPSSVEAWATTAHGGGSWAPSGVASDGVSIFAATGNTFGASDWSGGEAIVKLGAGPTFSGKDQDYFTPDNWLDLDNGDVDLGGTGPVLFDVPGASPGKLAIALGKDGKGYLLDRTNLGGVGGLVDQNQIASNEIINAAAAYRTDTSTYVVFRGVGIFCAGSGDLTAITVTAESPPKIADGWCASQNGLGSPMVTTTDGHSDVLVWSLGAEGGGFLRGFDGDTGTMVFEGGGDPIPGIARFSTPIAAKGRIFVAAQNTVVAFTP